MTPGEAVSRAQRRVLDLAAEESWREARLAEVAAAGRIDGPEDWDFDFDTIGDWWHEPEATPIHDALVLERLAAAAPRPSLWTRTPEWALAVGALVLLVLLALPLVLS